MTWNAALSATTATAVAIVILGPLLRAVLRARGRAALAKDLSLLTWPVRLTAVALVARAAAAATDSVALNSLSGFVLVIALAWVVLRILRVVQEVLFRQLEIDVTDNLRARSRRTQLELLRRVAAVLVVIGASAVLLLTVTPIARLGPTLVAYAGLIGVVLGIALRSPLESLAAGIIVAVSEPIRIDDVVVVEGEWGRVEHIGLGHVVVRIWDDRRLVLPTSRFVNEPFENWTKQSANVTGTITLSVDHGVDVDALRSFVEDAAARSPLWDGRAVVVQVVDIGERAVQVRALVTAASAPALWDLRCAIREDLLGFLREREQSLPVIRLDGPSRHPEADRPRTDA